MFLVLLAENTYKKMEEIKRSTERWDFNGQETRAWGAEQISNAFLMSASPVLLPSLASHLFFVTAPTLKTFYKNPDVKTKTTSSIST